MTVVLRVCVHVFVFLQMIWSLHFRIFVTFFLCNSCYLLINDHSEVLLCSMSLRNFHKVEIYLLRF